MEQYVASHLKVMNRQVVYQCIAANKVVSRPEIERETGISLPTVNKIADYLIRTGLISAVGEKKLAGAGRSPQMLSLNSSSFYIVSFLLEGEFLSVGVVDSTRQVIYHRTEHGNLSFAEVWNAIENHYVDDVVRESGIPEERLSGIGIALPAAVDPDRKTVNVSPMIGLSRPLDIKDRVIRLSKKYSVPVFIENDANAYCIGERILSGNSALKDMIFISVGTGIGCGIILNGKVLHGVEGNAGEIGDSYIDFSLSKKCRLEDYIGYEALLDRFSLHSLTGISSRQRADIIAFLSGPLAVTIMNTSVLLGCRNVVVGGVVAKEIGPALTESISVELKNTMNVALNLKFSDSEESGLIGIANELIEDHVSEIIAG